MGHAGVGELDLTVLIGGAEEWAAIQLQISTWLRRRGDDKFFKGHVVKRSVISLYCSVMLWIFQLMIFHKAQSTQLKI
jgi:hypothetical protein